VHSRRDPEKEARALIESQVPAGTSVGLFYGFGLGYLPEQFILAHPDASCLIIEPDIGLFLKALAARDLAVVLDHPKTVFFLASEPAPVVRYLDSLDLTSVQIVKLRPLFEKDRAYYERSDALIQSFLRQRDVNRNTLKRFGRRWVRNLAQNMRLLCLAPGISRAENLFAGMPALVCAGGPSLETILPHLVDLRERLLIIAVDTSLAALQRAGVDPDLTVICDPQYWNTRHIDAVKKTESILVSESSTHPRIFRRLGARVFFGSSVFPLGRALEALVGEKGKLGAGGSVATTAWDCARYLGCRPIYLAGLDLGFPAGKTHFRGAHFESVFFSTSSRLRPQEHSAFAYLREAQPFPVPSNAGGLVLTDHRMAVYKFWFETQMSLHPDVTTWNLSSGGVRIEGLPLAAVNGALALPPIRDRLAALMGTLASFLPQCDAVAEGRIAALKHGLTGMIDELEQTAAVARDGVRAALDLQKRHGRDQSVAGALEKLEAVDARLSELAAKNIAGFLAGPLIQEINRTSPQGTQPEQWLDFSLQLYRELEDSSRYHCRELKKGLAAL
jgi:hypothetical protein